jgi:virginiamycin A acetyltransferase
LNDPTLMLASDPQWAHIKNKTVLLVKTALEGKNTIHRDCVLLGSGADPGIQVGYASTLGFNCILTGRISIGRYCQFGSRISIHSNNHPMHAPSIYVNRQFLRGLVATMEDHESVSIGSDVWIGDNVSILKGVRIGNGAVIGAGSVVTRPVPDYAIAVGSPARVIRYRFEPKVCEAMLHLAYWNYPLQALEWV